MALCVVTGNNVLTRKGSLDEARASSPSKGSEVAVLEYKPDKMRRQLEMIVEAAKSQGGRVE